MNFLLAGFLTALPFAANAQFVGEDNRCEQIETMLVAGKSPSEVLAALVTSGMVLPEATVFAMGCGGNINRVAIATAGVELSSSLAEAQAVTAAVVVAAGTSSPEAAAAREALKLFELTAKQPVGYKSDYTPQGGGAVSASQ